MAAHGSKQDGIAVFCRFQGFLCQRYAVFVNGNAAHIHFCVMERMAEDLAHPVQNLFGLCDDLRARCRRPGITAILYSIRYSSVYSL